MRDKQISFPLVTGIGIILLIFLSANSNGQTVNPEWITDTMLLEDMDMAYHLYVPDDYDESLSYPLVVHLHGANLSMKQKLELLPTFRGPVDFVSESVQSKYPCIVLAPISTKESNVWIENAEPNGSSGFAPITNMDSYQPLLGLIDSIAQAYTIDTSRIYLNGISAGGVGAWCYLCEYPNYFAAALILCGHALLNNTESQMNSLMHIPIWNHHGDRDNVQPVEYSRRIFQNYEAQGIPVIYPDQQKYVKPKISDSLKKNITAHEIDYIYSEHKGKYHNVWDVCFDDTLVYEWLFSKRKRTKEIISFQDDSTESYLQAEHLFKIDCEVDSLKIVLQYSADLGYSWITVAEQASSEESILLNTQELDDSPQGQFRIQLLNDDGYIIGSDYSAYFKVDNAENFTPWIKHYLSAVKYGQREIAEFVEQLKVMLYANDVENDSLDLEFYIRISEDSEYEFLERRKIKAMNSDQMYFVNLDPLEVEKPTRIKFVLSDGANTVSDSTDIFYSLDYEKTELVVWPSLADLNLNDSMYLYYDIYPIYEADRVVSLYSKNPEIATIDGHVVHAVSPGQTYICFVAEADDGHFADSCRVTVINPVSNPASKIDLVRMYPNPTNDILRIHTGSEKPISIEVISINGQLLYTTIYHGSSQTLDLSSLQKGIYFITVRSEDFVSTRKIIKL